MTIDLAELRRLHALTRTESGDAYYEAVYRCLRAIPELLEEIERLRAYPGSASVATTQA